MSGHPGKECPDISKPIKGFRKTTVNGETVWLPRGISFVNGLWRVTVYGKQAYKTTFPKAWQNLCERLPSGVRQPAQTGPCKTLETGIIGVWMAFHFTSKHSYISVRVSQRLEGRARAIAVANSNLDNASQSWLDEALRLAAGLRWHYLAERNKGEMRRWLEIEDVPEEIIPAEPVSRVRISEAVEIGYQKRDAWLANKRAKKGE